MPSLINSDDGVVSGSAGLKTTGSNDGILALQNNGTTAVTIAANGNVNFAISGQRITGDFSNATVANRVIFQTSTVNGVTGVSAIPNGTGTQSNFLAYNSSDPANAAIANIRASATEITFASTQAGTGSNLPMTFYTGGSERMRIDTSGNLQFNSGYGSVATAYGCRAWVNFNGASANPITPTGSGNVSSVSKTSTGVFTVNLTNAMPDTNFAFTATTRTSNTIAQGRSTATTSSTIPIGTATASGAGVIDTVTHVAVFR